MSPTEWSALAISLVALFIALWSARSSKKSADAASELTLISATEFAATAPFFDVEWSGGRWTITNVKDTAAHNVDVQVEPYGCTLSPDTRTAVKGQPIQVFPKVYMPDQHLTITWTRTPDGGPNDEAVTRSFTKPRLDRQ